MTDDIYNNPFANRMFVEFEQKLYRIFGFGYCDLAIVLDRETEKGVRGHNLADNLAKAYEEGGPAQLRWEMNNTIACLQYIILSNRLERYASYEEWVEDIEKLNFGFCRKDLNPFDVQMFETNKRPSNKKVICPPIA